MQVPDGIDDLFDDHFGLLFRDSLVLFQVVRQVGALAVLKDSAEGVVVDFNGVVEFDDVGMAECLMDGVFPESVFDVVLLGAAVPVGVELVDFAGGLSHFLNIECFVYFTKPPFAQQPEQLVFFNSDPVGHSSVGVDFPVLGVFLLI